MDRAAFIISIDTEMAWGANHSQGARYRYDEERAHLARLVDLFDRYEIPATWAIVGHLMLESCEPVEGIKHPEVLRPSYDWFDGDWFGDDPATRAERSPNWYAPDLIDLLRRAKTPQEIASHGFSHMIADDPGCDRATYASEIRAAVRAAEAHDVILRSFVYPRNSIRHQDVLADHGFVAYRGKRPAPARPPSRRERIVDLVRGSEASTVRPIREGQLWNFPATIMFDIDRRPRTWPLWIRQVASRLDQAVDRRGLFHLWFHPHNLRDRPEQSFTALERICRAAADHRTRGALDTITMTDLADLLVADRS